MNKHTEIYKKKNLQINSVYFKKNQNQLGQLQVFVIGIARLWFSGENSRRDVVRYLTIKLGYFNGCKVSHSINNLFKFIYFYKPMIFFNPSNCMKITDDEKHIVELIFPVFNSDQRDLITAQSFVPKAETKKLVSLAKLVNFYLHGYS